MPLINYIGNRQECLDNKQGGRGNAPAPIFLDYLLVGGGQYGTNVAGGGGGVVSGSIRFLPRFTLDVTVGDGGIGPTLTDATPSIIESAPNEFFVYAGPGLSNGTSGEPQNNSGGGGTPSYSQGGGGGSQTTGSNGVNNQGGDGGGGSLWVYDDTYDQRYGGGGGGYGLWFIADEAIGGNGGQGGGGRGRGYTLFATNGVDTLGGGGGGVISQTNTDGGSGIVKMRYLSGSVSGAVGGTITVSGSYVYHTFTGSGQFVYQP